MASSLLIDEHPLILLPSLARMIGLNEAIVTQQLHFLLGMPRSGRIHEGERWIYNTYDEWQEQYFPFWSVPTIKRIFIELEKMHIVISDQPEGRYSRRKYYRLNRGMMAKLVRENLRDLPRELEPEEDADGINLIPSGKGSKRAIQRDQNDTFLIAETSIAENRLLSREDLKSRRSERNPINTSSPNHHPISRPPLPPLTLPDEI